MTGKTPEKLQSPDNILETNPNVSRSVVSQYQELKKQLEGLGVKTKPSYTLTPPLGDTVPGTVAKKET